MDYYIRYLDPGIPIYAWISSVFFLVIVCIYTYLKKNVNRSRAISFALLVVYVFAVFGSTVLFRPCIGKRLYVLTPFQSYITNVYGEDVTSYWEIFLNVVLFVPFGFLMRIAYQKSRCWQILCYSFIFSASIEALQFVLIRGICEFDDVIHNTLGCLIGCGLYSLCRYRQIKPRQLKDGRIGSYK